MKDNHFALFSLLAIAGAIAWYYLEKAPGAPEAVQATSPLPVPWDTPMSDVFDANPTAYAPATPASLTVNVANQSPNLLSNQYQPLFGFVGIAQGEAYP
jgi:hypothetical protein